LSTLLAQGQFTLLAFHSVRKSLPLNKFIIPKRSQILIIIHEHIEKFVNMHLSIKADSIRSWKKIYIKHISI
jgi:hypothetical protein